VDGSHSPLLDRHGGSVCVICGLILGEAPLVDDEGRRSSHNLWQVMNDNGLLRTRDKAVARELRKLCLIVGVTPLEVAEAHLSAARPRDFESRRRCGGPPPSPLRHRRWRRLDTREEAAALLMAAKPNLPISFVAFKTGVSCARLREALAALGITTYDISFSEDPKVTISFAISRSNIRYPGVAYARCEAFIARHPNLSVALATGASLSEYVGLEVAADAVGIKLESLQSFCFREKITPGSEKNVNQIYDRTLKRLRRFCGDARHPPPRDNSDDDWCSSSCPTCILRFMRPPLPPFSMIR
jgi:hypothetical protein